VYSSDMKLHCEWAMR